MTTNYYLILGIFFIIGSALSTIFFKKWWPNSMALFIVGFCIYFFELPDDPNKLYQFLSTWGDKIFIAAGALFAIPDLFLENSKLTKGTGFFCLTLCLGLLAFISYNEFLSADVTPQQVIIASAQNPDPDVASKTPKPDDLQESEPDDSPQNALQKTEPDDSLQNSVPEDDSQDSDIPQKFNPNDILEKHQADEVLKVFENYINKMKGDVSDDLNSFLKPDKTNSTSDICEELDGLETAISDKIKEINESPPKTVPVQDMIKALKLKRDEFKERIGEPELTPSTKQNYEEMIRKLKDDEKKLEKIQKDKIGVLVDNLKRLKASVKSWRQYCTDSKYIIPSEPERRQKIRELMMEDIQKEYWQLAISTSTDSGSGNLPEDSQQSLHTAKAEQEPDKYPEIVNKAEPKVSQAEPEDISDQNGKEAELQKQNIEKLKKHYPNAKVAILPETGEVVAVKEGFEDAGIVIYVDGQGKQGTGKMSDIEIIYDPSKKAVKDEINQQRVPQQIREIHAEVLYEYPGGNNQLKISTGERLTIGKEQGGWYWAVNQRGQAGWVQASHIKLIEITEHTYKVGDSVMVKWQGALYHAEVIELGDSRWKIRIDFDQGGGVDAWVGADQIKPAD